MTVPFVGQVKKILDLGAGDIIFCGPTEYNIHHAILVCGELQRDFELASLLPPDSPAQQPGMEVWRCRSIQSTQRSVGDDTWWFPATLYLLRNSYLNTAALMAEYPDNSDTIEVGKESVPIKVLLHPLRRECGGG